jgi:hypothetical protein
MNLPIAALAPLRRAQRSMAPMRAQRAIAAQAATKPKEPAGYYFIPKVMVIAR